MISLGRKHHLHIDVGVHVHTLAWEAAHLSWHHHASWELTHIAHIHVHWGWHSLRVLSHVASIHLNGATVGSSVLVLSEFSLSMGVRALALIFTVAI